MFKNLVIKCVYVVARLCFILLSKHAFNLLFNLIFNIMEKDKFNYQVVFKLDDDSRIIFAGSSSNCVTEIVESCANFIKVDISFVENVIYQPYKIQNYETQKNS